MDPRTRRPLGRGTTLSIVAALLVSELFVAAPSALAITCSRRVNVTFISYTGMDEPKSNGCWKFDKFKSFQSERQAWITNPAWLHPAEWRICHWDKPPEGAQVKQSAYWVYDDTNPGTGGARTRSAEKARIADCINASGTRPPVGYQRPYGYVLMAAKKGDCGSLHHCWRRVNPGGKVRRFYAQLYISDQDTMSKFGEWKALKRNRGAPLLNIGYGDVEANVLKVCRAVKSGGWIGLYSPVTQPGDPGHKPIEGQRLKDVIQGLKTCTTT